MVQQLRSSLQHGEVVAAGDVDKAVKISQSSQKREREETAEGDGKESKEANVMEPFGTGETSATNDTDPRSLGLDTPASQGWRNGTKRHGGGEGLKVKTEKNELEEKLEALKKTLVQKGLNDAEILAQFEEMEQATKETSQQPVVLTHKVLHQLQKTEKQISSVQVQIQELDSKWKQWSEYMKVKYTETGKSPQEPKERVSEETCRAQDQIGGFACGSTESSQRGGQEHGPGVPRLGGGAFQRADDDLRFRRREGTNGFQQCEREESQEKESDASWPRTERITGQGGGKGDRLSFAEEVHIAIIEEDSNATVSFIGGDQQLVF